VKESHRFERDLELHETHLSIRTTLRWIGAELDSSQAPGKTPLGALALLEALQALHADLERHFELEEGGAFPFLHPQGGAPDADELERWRREHRNLASRLDGILADLGRAALAGSPVPEELRPVLRRWFEALANHERAESPSEGA